MIDPQHMLVEERGLEKQIKRLSLLIPTAADKKKDEFIFTATYLAEQLTEIVQDLKDINLSIRYENDRILTDKLKENKKDYKKLSTYNL